MRNLSFSSLFAQLLVFSFGFGPASACRWSEGLCFLPRQGRVKVAADRGLWLTQAGEREGWGILGEAVAAETSVTLQPSEACRAFSRGSCPWITGAWK